MCLIHKDFQVFISYTQLLASFYGKNLERVGFKVLLSLQANKLGSVAK
jgi:hypothetical protein